MKSPAPIAINAAIILKKKSVHADHSGVCDIFSAERKKRGRGPFHPVQYGQKSVLNLYMIGKKMHLLQSKRSKSPCYAQYFALPQVKHVTLILVSTTSRVTGKCSRRCVRIPLVKRVRISPVTLGPTPMYPQWDANEMRYTTDSNKNRPQSSTKP